MRVFIDTNLWAYRLDRREATKSERVRGWLAEITDVLEALNGFELLGTDANLILDALIAEPAIRSRCTVLDSEDFGHGRRTPSQPPRLLKPAAPQLVLKPSGPWLASPAAPAA